MNDDEPREDDTRPPTEDDLPKTSGLPAILTIVAIGVVTFYFAANVCNLR